MDSDAFWDLIDSARTTAGDPDDSEAVGSALVDLLVATGTAGIEEFQAAWAIEDARAYGWPLWGAAYLVEGGCSDDGFDYFIGWLIGQGRAVFEAAVRDPDSLADHLGPDDAEEIDGEEVLGAPLTARHRLTGSYEGPATAPTRAELGAEWDFDDADEMQRRYPRLYAVFG